ncbi:alpha/beta hydrolase [Christiangramia sp. SM2212]|uniref:Alpha/beta hydrolase n=1 Tax=Christiangramia sediminicola TaxID=3073267 RepID=A0ABU1ER85_9FLAO|nr:alpha/beta hydrolase [Christiangramia sp. SM2212]MDR5590499.1 alpha/beta hydrolase [Christiangramia sp. SM2212]
MIYTQSNGINLDNKVLNLVFIHGNSMNSDLFMPQLKSREFKDYNCIALDLPGHGKSDKSESYSISVIVEKVSEKLSELKRFILVGHSLGGQIAIHLLEKYPNQCKGIVLIGTPPLDPNFHISDIYNLNSSSQLLLQKDLKDDEIFSLQKFLYPKVDKWTETITKSLVSTDSEFRIGYGSSLMDLKNLNEVKILDQFKGYVQVIVGEKDSLLKISYLKKVCTSLCTGLNIIDDCGHFPHLEKPEIINQLILSQIHQIEK